MPLDLIAIARAVGGECRAHGVPGRHPVDAVAPIAELVVVGNPDFATLVTGSLDELRGRIAEGPESVGVLAGAAYVTGADGEELRRLVAANGISAILGAESSGAELHARLTALIAEDQAAADRLVTAGTKVLTQVARRGGMTAVITELAHRIDGWAVLLDRDGHLIGSAGAGRLHIEDAVAVALGRPVRVRHHGLQVHQVGSDRELAGYLVIASRSSVTSRNRDLASQAAALFDLVLRTRDPSLTEHLGREALIDTLLAGGPRAVDLLRRWEVRDASLTAFSFGSRARTVDLERLISRWFDEFGIEHVFVSETGLVRGFVPDELVEKLVARVGAFRPVGAGRVHLGLGRPAPVDALDRGAIQARQAFIAALESGRAVQRYEEMPTVEFVLDAMPEDQGRRLTEILNPLRNEHGEHGDLARTLYIFLSEHGRQRSSAARLGIHRQTLGARLQRIESLTGLSMDRPDDRAAAWLALRALGL